jgi:hypothetical protein
MFSTMHAGRAPSRGSKAAVPPVHDLSWTAITLVVAASVAIAVVAFYWFID